MSTVACHLTALYTRLVLACTYLIILWGGFLGLSLSLGWNHISMAGKALRLGAVRLPTLRRVMVVVILRVDASPWLDAVPVR